MSRISERWLTVYRQLIQYRRDYGHWNVPRKGDFRPLALWVKNQRYEYSKGRLPDAKVQLLNNVNFVWDQQQANWEEKFNELKNFKARYQHCNVPQRSKEFHNLAIWVSTQRLAFKRGKLCKERFLLLDAEGFDWAPHETKRKKRYQQRFNKKDALGYGSVDFTPTDSWSYLASM